MKSVHGVGLKFPADDCRLAAAVTADPGVGETARGIDFEEFAFDVERCAVGADAIAAPFASGADVGGGFGDAVEAVLSPPARDLRGITDGLEHARGWSGDEDFGDDGVLIGSDSGGGHECSFDFRFS